jgi:hypothetical protein
MPVAFTCATVPVILNRRGRWWVEGGDEQLGPFATYKEAKTARDQEQRAARGITVRACLCCRTPFASEGAHNRLCEPCRKRGDEPADWFGAGHRIAARPHHG